MARPSSRATLRLGTRGGDLASWQAREAARVIVAAHPDVAVEIMVIRTAGDRAPAAPIAEIGGTGVFTRDIEDALRSGAIDLAVHSLKDLPTRVADGLALAAILERADPRDALVAPPGSTLAGLPPGARVGTSSPRRRAQVLAQRPELVTIDVRGNVPTRLAKLDRGDFDALVLACAGLQRLGLDARIAEVFGPEVLVPAPGQGALAVETRADDHRVASLLQAIDHRPTRIATQAERALLATLEGGCHAPVGALATWADQVLTLTGVVTSLQGDRSVRGSREMPVRTVADAEAAGVQLALSLLAQGGTEILDEIRLRERGDRAHDRKEP
ncbi:MAG: hydroxymethylbilane synthase [Rhodospirillaceae bacterium]